ncbi:RecQ family ATP-dependent DNA helicase [Aquimarina intermedia]|uniref:ATP-dependent DNA helicase RecQ n=1 Tax=Aquimarina intermedia TaxID=350814 RepID=A0A5S5C919_9FLAO|nr:RecQ family ATP-dependent DNA helicase [Aquimarina intermedia]TYP75108.1 ATP-dependent DNA helicase RecQ [Aquimarina intermedia]
MSSALQILHKYWKHESFKPSQEQVITSLADGNDTLALLPTGGGKSICFQVPALMQEGICIVISPLIALMQDQVRNLNDRGIKALALPSGISYKDLDTLLDNCIYGNYRFLYLSPERLLQDLVQERIKRMKVNYVAVDEAHCISQWGNDFRPSYKKIKILRQIHPTVPIIALTASATPKVIEDIKMELELFQPNIYKASFYRNNLGYWTIKATDKRYQLLRILKKYEGSSILYVRNRKTAVELTEFLKASHIKAEYYHGGVDSKLKTERFNSWMQDKTRVMVATNAFGMGIDKPDVRTVIHYHIPESIESYFQEAGRGGRDDKQALAFLLHNENDSIRLDNQFIKVLPDSAYVQFVYRKLSNYFQISYGEGEQSIHDFNFNTFCKTYNLNTTITYNALLLLDRCSVISFVQRFSKKSAIHITSTQNQLLNYSADQKVTSLIIKGILRTYGGIFDDETPINIPLLASKLAMDETLIINTLTTLQDEGLLTFTYAQSDAEIIFLVPREDELTINRIRHHIKEYTQSKVEKVAAMVSFIKNTSQCRSQQLLEYFGEKKPDECEICSYCYTNQQNKTSFDTKAIQHQIVVLLKNKNQSSRTLVEQLAYPETVVLEIIKEMNIHGVIKINPDNTYQLTTI